MTVAPKGDTETGLQPNRPYYKRKSYTGRNACATRHPTNNCGTLFYAIVK